jgi:hypothetical protein
LLQKYFGGNKNNFYFCVIDGSKRIVGCGKIEEINIKTGRCGNLPGVA